MSVASDGDPPSFIWLGGGGYWASNYSCAASVWGNSYVDNGEWTYDQRLYQYTSGHSETWGGVSLTVDSDAAIGGASPVQYDDYSDEPNEFTSPSYDVPPC